MSDSLLPVGCGECGWAADVLDGDLPVLCPRCGRPSVSLDVDSLSVTEDIRQRFLKAQGDALSRWHQTYSDTK